MVREVKRLKSLIVHFLSFTVLSNLSLGLFFSVVIKQMPVSILVRCQNLFVLLVRP